MDALEQIANRIQQMEQDQMRLANDLATVKQLFQGHLTAEAAHVNTLYSKLQGVSAPPATHVEGAGPAEVDPAYNPTATPVTNVNAVAPQETPLGPQQPVVDVVVQGVPLQQ